MKSIIVNLDKRQYLVPEAFGDEPGLEQFAAASEGVLLGLAVLLADGNGRGGGDLHSDSALIGSWAGDRVVIACEAGTPGEFCTPGVDMPLYQWAMTTFIDISDGVIDAISADPYSAASSLNTTVPYAMRKPMRLPDVPRFFHEPTEPLIRSLASLFYVFSVSPAPETDLAFKQELGQVLSAVGLKAWGTSLVSVQVLSYLFKPGAADKPGGCLDLIASAEGAPMRVQLQFPLAAAPLLRVMEELAPEGCKQAKETLALAQQAHAAYKQTQAEQSAQVLGGEALVRFQQKLAGLAAGQPPSIEGV